MSLGVKSRSFNGRNALTSSVEIQLKNSDPNRKVWSVVRPRQPKIPRVTCGLKALGRCCGEPRGSRSLVSLPKLTEFVLLVWVSPKFLKKVFLKILAVSWCADLVF